MSGCPQAWHGGLHVGVLRNCKYDAGHRGPHRDAEGHVQWAGKLTDEELTRAAELRTAAQT